MFQVPSVGLMERKSYDPFYCLPLELAERIFQMLEIHSRVICLRVCKSWMIMLQSLHSLWKTLNLGRSTSYIPMDSLQAFLKRSNYSLDLVKINLSSYVGNDSLDYIIENCKYLKELKVFNHDLRGNMKFNSLSSAKQIILLHICQNIPVNLSVIISTLERCQDTLVDVKFGNLDKKILNTSDWPRLNNLKSLSLGEADKGYLNRNDEIAVIDLDGLVQATPNLITIIIEHLKVRFKYETYDFRPWKQLQRLRFINNKLKRFPRLPQNLRHLSFDANCALSIPESQEKELTPLPLLESFSCQATAINPRGLFAITKSCIEANNLKILHIGNRIYDLGNHILPVWMEYPPSTSVEELSLAWMELDDAGISRILKLYPKLKKIILSGNYITDLSLQSLIDMKSIKSVVIDECSDLSPNAIEEMKKRGIEIRHKFL